MLDLLPVELYQLIVRDDYIVHRGLLVIRRYVESLQIDIRERLGFTIQFYSGDTIHYHREILHRFDGPAIERADGDRSWYQNGELHRIDGPAIECISGYHAWYQYGKLHRVDGPAIEWANGEREWWIDGKQIK